MRNTPTYTIAEAARHIKIAPSTLRSWVKGRNYPKDGGKGSFAPLLSLPAPENSYLSFDNLIEAFVIRALRHEHGISIRKLRQALDYAESKLNVSHLLLSPDLSTNAGNVFIRRYGELINLSLSGQLAMRKILEKHLKRIEWENNHPSRLYPFGDIDDEKLIAIDPKVQFGRPFILRKGISTEVIISRLDSGESIGDIAADYDLRKDEVELALIYEHAA